MSHRPIAPLRWRSVWVCLAIFGLTALVSAPPAKTFLWQWGEMLPPLGGYLWRDPYAAVGHQIQHDRPIMTARIALQRVADEPDVPFDARPYVGSDSDNGLYACLELLSMLRRDQDEDAIARGIRTASRAGPSRLYLRRQYALAEATFRAGGVTPRRAARAAYRVRYWVPPLREAHDPIVRELTARLTVQADRLRETGRISDATAADALVVRFLTDMAVESDLPDVVLLAADLLPRALEGLAADGEAAASTAEETAGADDFATACASLGDRLTAWRASWFEYVHAEGINALPYTGVSIHALLVPDVHMRALRSACMSLFVLVAGGTLAVAQVVLLVIAGVTWRRDGERMHWRHGGRGKGMAAMLIWGPLLILMWLALPGRSIEAAWFISLPSLRVVFGLPALVLVLVGLAVRWGIEGQASRADGWSRIAPYVYLALTLVLAVVAVWAIMRPPSHVHLPTAVRLTRIVGTLSGIFSVAILFVWAAVMFVRRGAGRVSIGLTARAWLHVTSPGLVVAGVLMLGVLGLNRQRDGVHEAAFARVAADPLTASVGQWPGLDPPPASLLNEARRLAHSAVFMRRR